jgi:hypothetical protein
MTYKIGDLILIYFYDNVPALEYHKQPVKEKRLAVVITEVEDKDGYIKAQYLEERTGVKVANLLPRRKGLDGYGRRVTEIISR